MCLDMQRKFGFESGMRISIVTNTAKVKCPQCRLLAYASDVIQFGRCITCAERLVGPITRLRDILGPEPDEDEFRCANDMLREEQEGSNEYE